MRNFLKGLKAGTKGTTARTTRGVGGSLCLRWHLQPWDNRRHNRRLGCGEARAGRPRVPADRLAAGDVALEADLEPHATPSPQPRGRRLPEGSSPSPPLPAPRQPPRTEPGVQAAHSPPRPPLGGRSGSYPPWETRREPGTLRRQRKRRADKTSVPGRRASDPLPEPAGTPRPRSNGAPRSPPRHPGATCPTRSRPTLSF